jgi:hypothetical protein
MHHHTGRRSLARVLKKPRRLGTTAALAIGLTAVPTLAVAVTTDALPGDPFKLGQENTITGATTTLTGNDTSLNNTRNGVLHVRERERERRRAQGREPIHRPRRRAGHQHPGSARQEPDRNQS